MAGRLIVFEGGEGAGKSTQLRYLHDWLIQHPLVQQLQAQQIVSEVVSTREPGGTLLGQSIRQLLLDSSAAAEEPMVDRAELLLYAADRAQHVDQWIVPRLQQGALILCDRFTDSTVAYQGYGRGLSLDLIDQLNQIATGGCASDLTLWLDVDVEVGLARTQKRGQADRMEQNNWQFHQRVRQGFQALAAAQPQRTVRIDANGEPQAVTAEIQQILEAKLHDWYGS